MTTLKKETLFIENYEKSACNISVTCKKIGISRETFYRWRKTNPKFDSACLEIEEGLIDMAETMLLKGIKEGKTTEIIFYLKTKGKSRGYIEGYEIKHQNKEDRSIEEIQKELQKIEKIING